MPTKVPYFQMHEVEVVVEEAVPLVMDSVPEVVVVVAVLAG